MNYLPQDQELRNHINHYWIVNNSHELFSSSPQVFGYPGIHPEIIFIVKGHLKYEYEGKYHETNRSILASHINGRFLFDSSDLYQFIIVRFEPRSLSALLPFIRLSSKELMKNSLCHLDEIYGSEAHKLELELADQDEYTCVAILDQFFHKKLSSGFSGFIVEMLHDLKFDERIPVILERTGYSISTLERHVKNETALTPKAFLGLRKYKAAVEEINRDHDHDWQYYIEKYNYTDQSHFIKTIKRYTGFTPTELVNIPNLISFRE